MVKSLVFIQNHRTASRKGDGVILNAASTNVGQAMAYYDESNDSSTAAEARFCEEGKGMRAVNGMGLLQSSLGKNFKQSASLFRRLRGFAPGAVGTVLIP